MPRTTNSVESWHNRLRVLLGGSNVGLITFLEELRKEEAAIRSKIAQARAIGRVARNRLQNRERAMQQLLEERTRSDMQPLEFLELMSIRLQMQN